MTKPSILILATSLATAPAMFAAPSIAAQGVKNAASYADPRLPNGPIAEGSIFNIFGSAMGPATIAYASTLPLPTTLSGTTVSVTVSGTTLQCYMFYTSAGQVAAILPSNTPVGTGTITVSYNGTASPTAPITVVKSNLGIFTVNQQGSGTAVILDGNNNVSSSTFSFQPGETVVAWGTGLGPISGADNTPPPSGNLPGVSVVVTVGGQQASVAYAGRSGYSGEDQIDFTIPSGTTGCNVPVSITVTNGNAVTTSNWVSMAISSTAGSCTSISQLPTGVGSGSGPLRIGSVLWNHSVTTSLTLSPTLTLMPTTTTADQGEAGFESYSTNPYTSAANFDVPYGTCVILPQVTPAQLQITGLDAGQAINITGNGANRSITETTQATGSYYNIIGGGVALPGQTTQPLFFTGGSYSFNNGPGGKDVGGFTGNITVPSTPFAWTNYSSTTAVPRSSPLVVNWTGGDPTWDIFLTGNSIVSLTTGSLGVTFECRAHDSDGTITVPVSILSQLPPSGTESVGPSSIPLGSLTLLAGPSTYTTANVSGLDFFFYEYSVEYQNSNVPFQ